MKMKWILYGHGGSGNHGCEAIVRSMLKILNRIDSTSSNELMSNNPVEDMRYKLDEIISVHSAVTNKFPKFSKEFIVAYIKMKFFHKYQHLDALPYISAIGKKCHEQIALSIGGDNYCYGDTSNYAYLNRVYNKHGIKTVMVGCSIETHVIKNPKVVDDLCNYSQIIARESITYNALIDTGLNNSCLLPDPAFVLDRKDLLLPNGFIAGNTVGINISPVIISCEKNKGKALENYVNLMQYIISKTNMNIALIPHVVWADNDDRIPLQLLYDRFKDTNRVVKVEDCTAEELKGYIARCRFVVAARTHASIAAYSTCVPTLVVGYSVKAKGIAKDIFGTHENYVVPVQSLQDKSDLTNSFKWLQKNETLIKNHLNNFMPEYCKRALLIGDELNKLI